MSKKEIKHKPSETALMDALHRANSKNKLNKLLPGMHEYVIARTAFFDSLFQARIKLRDYFNVYNFRRKHRSLKKRSPYQYIKTFFSEFADKHPFAFSDTLSRIASESE